MALVGLFGGSFDPIHNGHIAIAREAIKLCNLSKLWFIPAKISPLKQGCMVLDDTLRIKLINTAISGDSSLGVSNIEIEKSGVSYTVETLLAWKKLHPQDEIIFIIGMDSLLSFHKWHNWQKILELAKVVTFHRPSYDKEPKSEDLHLPAAASRLLLDNLIPGPLVDASSTQVRTLLAKSDFRKLEALLPLPVLEYFKDHPSIMKDPGGNQ